jgi:hypothetical protein
MQVLRTSVAVAQATDHKYIVHACAATHKLVTSTLPLNLGDCALAFIKYLQRTPSIPQSLVRITLTICLVITSSTISWVTQYSILTSL